LEELPPLSELGNLVEQSPNTEINLDAAFAPIDSVSMGEGLMDEDGEDDTLSGAETAEATEADVVAEVSEEIIEESGMLPPAQLH
jgi:hypothetical protein